MATTQPRVELLLRSFKDNDNLDALTEAFQLVQHTQIDESEPLTAKVAFRDNKMQQYLLILNELDGKLIPNLDFKDLPQLSVSPPEDSGLPAGVDPSSIADPKTRFKYEQSILENQQKANRYSFQKKLLNINQRITDKVESYITGGYFDKDQDATTLYTLINNVVSDEGRRLRLMQFAESIRKMR